MWSYRDTQGNIHSHLSIEDVRKAIKQGEIDAKTPLLNQQIGTWQAAENTAFFTSVEDCQKNATQLPISKTTKKQLLKPPPPSSGQLGSRKTNYKKQVFSITLCLVFYTPLAFFLWQLKQVQQQKEQLESETLELSLLHQAKQEAETTLQIKKDTLQHFQKRAEKWSNEKLLQQAETLKTLQEGYEQARIKQSKFNTLSPIPNHSNQLKLLMEKKQKTLQFSLFSTALFIVPFCYFLPSYKKATAIWQSKNLSKKKDYSAFVMILQSLPIIQLLIYLLYSATWNLEGKQRKNNLLITLPCILATAFCYALVLKCLYTNSTQQALILLLPASVLQLIVHLRFLQMLDYFEKMNLKNTTTRLLF